MEFIRLFSLNSISHKITKINKCLLFITQMNCDNRMMNNSHLIMFTLF